MQLTALNKKLPLKAYIEKDLDIILATQFKYWISQLLSIKAENEEKVDFAIPSIKKQFHSLGLDEVKKAFEMYALGELKTKPISNHFDLILVGNIFNDYRDYKKVQPEKKTSEEKEKEYKESQDYIYAIQIFDFYVQNKELPIESYWLYDYLETKEILKYTKGAKSSAFKMAAKNSGTEENQIQQAKLLLLCDHFNKLIEIGSHLKNQL